MGGYLETLRVSESSRGTSAAGADGTRCGWVVVTEECPNGRITWDTVPQLDGLFEGNSALEVLAVDIPIGLPELGARTCDHEARRLLGRLRASSVFPAPIRPVLQAKTQAEAGDIRFRIEGKRMSVQAWAIMPKVREVDTLLRNTPTIRPRLREVHPELCFLRMTGRAMAHGKKRLAGRLARREALATVFDHKVLDEALRECSRINCAPDDMLDAFAALWTARRIRDGQAQVLPALPELDAVGLQMEMAM